MNPDNDHHEPGKGTSTDDRIIHATLSLIQRHGLGSVTMSQIAERAGIARQTLYNHHRDIDSIVVATLKQHNDESLRLLRMSMRTSATATQKIEQLARHFVMIGSHSQTTTDIQNALSTEARAVLDDYRTTVEGEINRVLENGVETGEFRMDIDLSNDTRIVHAMLQTLQNLAAVRLSEASTITASGTRTILAALKSA